MAPDPQSVVARDTPVRVVFGEPMDTTSLTEDAYGVDDGSGPLAGSSSYDADLRQWTWTPTGLMPIGAPLRVVVSSSVRSTAGHRPGEDFSFPFSVADGALSPIVGLGLDDSRVPILASISPRRVLVAQGQQVFEDRGGGFVAAPLPATARALACDAFGGAVALCSPDDRELQFVRHGGGTLDTWSVVAQHATAGTRALTMRNNTRGDLLVRWVGDSLAPAGPGEGLAVLMADRAIAMELHAAPGSPSPVAPAIDSRGRAVTLGLQFSGQRSLDPVWMQLPGPQQTSQVLRLPAGADVLAFDCDAAGVAYAVYQVEANGATELRCARAASDRYLGDDLLQRGDPVSWVQFAVGNRGDAMCLFVVGSAPRTLRASGFRGRSSTWFATETLADDLRPFQNGGNAVLAVTDRGTSFVAYQRPASATNYELVLRRGFAGVPFGAPIVVTIAPANEYVARPALAAEESGRAVMAFTTRPLSVSFPRSLRVVRFE